MGGAQRGAGGTRGAIVHRILSTVIGCTSAAELLALLARIAREQGYDAVTLGELAGGPASRLSPFFHTTWPAAWVEVYRAAGLQREDRAVLRAVASETAFTWADMPELDDWWLPDGSQKFMEFVRAFGWNAGFHVPIHGPDRYRGLVAFQGAHPDQSDAALGLLEAVARLAFQRMRLLHAATAGETLLGLTPRERAVLTRLVRGEEDEEIGAALAISGRTVLHHVAQLKQKLGANSRAHLGAQAIRFGLVEG